MKNIFIVGIFILICAIIAVIIFFVKKKNNNSSSSNSQKNNNIQVNFRLGTNSGNFSFNQNNLPNYTMSQLVNDLCSSLNISLTDVSWINLYINEASVSIMSNGAIDPNQLNQTLLNFLNTNNTTALNIYGNYCLYSQYPNNIDICKGQTGVCSVTGWVINNNYCPIGSDLENCCKNSSSGVYATCFNGNVVCSNCPGPVPATDPCKGEIAVCTFSGWEKQSGHCPTGIDLYNCCNNSSSGVYATCDNNGNVICGNCPGNISCDGITCDNLLGPLCTATGWICASGYGCPSDISACCENKQGTCIANPGKKVEIFCGCTQSSLTCTPGCNMCGLFCSSTGFVCAQGQTCPDFETMISCCTDPAKPVPVCNKTTNNPAGCNDTSVNQGITCTDCSSFPKPNCQQSCDGQGLVCTATGWVCRPNTTCPTDPSIIGNCCTGLNYNLTPYCDSSTNSIKCRCPDNYTSCQNNSTCPNFCCSAGTRCYSTPSDSCICCHDISAVCGDICCPEGQICQNGNCVSSCGTNVKNNNLLYCDPNQTCVEIDGLNQNLITKLENQYGNSIRISQDGTTAYMCSSGNSCSGDNEVSLPSSLKNYYPCLQFPLDSITELPGYCIEKNNLNNPIGTCFNNHDNSTDCNSDSTCEWKDIFNYATTNDMGNALNIIQEEINIAQNNFNGFYCDPSNGATNYSRIIGFNLPNCNVSDCIYRLSQPGITQIVFDENTSNCAGLQTCGSNETINVYSIDNGAKTKFNYNLNGNSGFAPCSVNTTCPIPVNDSTSLCVSFTGAGNYIPNPYPVIINN